MIIDTYLKEEFLRSIVRGSTPDSCWGWKGRVQNKGYAVIYYGKPVLAHRLSVVLHTGVVSSLFVLHSCDNPVCTNPLHLRYGTAQDNSNDMVARNRCRNKYSLKPKLSKAEICCIFLSSPDIISKDLAAVYGVSASTIRMIRTGNVWGTVTSTLNKIAS